MKARTTAIVQADTLSVSQEKQVLFCNEKQIEQMTNGALKVSWLQQARWKGNGPPYIKLGRRVMYERQAVIDWLRQRSRTSTTDSQGAAS